MDDEWIPVSGGMSGAGVWRRDGRYLKTAPPTSRGPSLLAETRPSVEEPAVCHGDLCPPNVLLDPDTLAVTGLIDVGRLEFYRPLDEFF